jgi:hypothetical protein
MITLGLIILFCMFKHAAVLLWLTGLLLNTWIKFDMHLNAVDKDLSLKMPFLVIW